LELQAALLAAPILTFSILPLGPSALALVPIWVGFALVHLSAAVEDFPPH
jgi:hypothetical protein